MDIDEEYKQAFADTRRRVFDAVRPVLDDLAFHNFVRNYDSIGTPLKIRDLSEYEYPSQVLYLSFQWRESAEGVQYWKNHYLRIRAWEETNDTVRS